MQYVVTLNYVAYAEFTIEANSAAEALEKARTLESQSGVMEAGQLSLIMRQPAGDSVEVITPKELSWSGILPSVEVATPRTCRNCVHCLVDTKECYEGGYSELGDLDQERTEDDCNAWRPRS